MKNQKINVPNKVITASDIVIADKIERVSQILIENGYRYNGNSYIKNNAETYFIDEISEMSYEEIKELEDKFNGKSTPNYKQL